MNERILERFLTRQDDASPAVTEDGSSTEAFGCFGWLRGIRDRALMLELRMANGNIHCFGYPWLERVVLNPSEGIELQFGPKKVEIRGINLGVEIQTGVSLLSGITRHRISWIAVSEFADQSKRTLPYIESITIK